MRFIKTLEIYIFYFSKGLFEVLCDYGIYYISSNTLLDIKPEYVDGIFADQNVKNLIASQTKFDALVTFSTFSEFTIQFADLLKIPLIEVGHVPGHSLKMISNFTHHTIFSKLKIQHDHYTVFKRYPGVLWLC